MKIRETGERAQKPSSPRHQISQNVPPRLALTDLRPDLVAYDVQIKSVLLLELTVCFETNFEDARKRKEDKIIMKKVCFKWTSMNNDWPHSFPIVVVTPQRDTLT